MSKKINIGEITTNQGNKGEVRVLPLTDHPERFELLKRVFLAKNNKTIEMNIENVWYHNQFVIIKFAGVDSIGEALVYKDYVIKIPEEELISLSEDQFYIYRLIDFKVSTVQGRFLGKLSDILSTGGADIFLVKGEQKDYMIPATRDFVVKIDQKAHRIIIDPIPGLLDL